MITRILRKNFFKKIAGNTIALLMMVMTAVPMPALAIIYSPGATLNPSCLPTDVNCGVTPPLSSATSTPTTAVAFNGTSTTTPSTFAYATSTNFIAMNATTTSLTTTIANIVTAIIDTLTARVATIYGLTVGTLTATSTAQFLAGASAPFFTATSTTATSTFAGPLSAGSLKVGTLSGLLLSNAGTVAIFATSTATTGQALLVDGSGALSWSTVQPTVADWAASTAVVAGELRLVAASGSTVFNVGQLIRSNSARTTGTGFTSTEAANWTAVGATDPSVAPNWSASTFVFIDEIRTATVAVGGFQAGQLIKSVSTRTTGTTFDSNEAGSFWIAATKQNSIITDWTAGETISQNEIRRATSAAGIIKSGDLIRNTTAGSRVTASTFSTESNSWVSLVSTPQAILPWAASTAVYPGEMRVATADTVIGIRMGDIIYDNLTYTRTTGSTFDTTEAAYWTVAHKVSSKARAWVASSPVEADEIRTATVAVGGFQAGQLIKSNSARNTTATFDATEAGNWTSVAVHLGSLSGLLFANNGALASFATSTATAGQVLGISGGSLAWVSQSGGSGATTTVNGVNGPTFIFSTGTTGTDFNVATSTGALAWNLPNASAGARGLVSTTTQTFAGDKTFAGKLFLTQGTATSSLIGMTSGGTRMRLTSGTSDTQDNDQGASVDLQTVAAGGGLDFVSGRGGATNFWTSTSTQTAQQRMILTKDGNLGIGTMTPAQQLSLSNSLRLENTSASNIGVIYKGVSPFIHNFVSLTGGTVVPSGTNTFVGANAGNFTMGSTATVSLHGVGNVGIGTNSLSANTTGYQNVTAGNNSLLLNTTGGLNAAIGDSALYSNTIGNANVAFGANALYSNGTGYANTANGVFALHNNTSGYYNTALGYSTMYENTTGNNNVGVGYQSGRYIADGASANASSSNSLYFGNNIRAFANGDTNEIVIGNDATGLGSNTLSLGNSSTTLTYLRGNVGIGTTTPNNALSVNGAITLASTTPATTTSALYNEGGTLKWNGTAVSGGSQITGTQGQTITFNSLGTQVATSTLFIATNGNVGIGTTTPAQQLSLTKSLRFENTTASDVGVIYKGANRFIHNFVDTVGAGAVPAGNNTFVGLNSGNFTMGSNATQVGNASYNTGIGVNALSSNDNGQGHTAIGYNALLSNVNGTFNTAIGAGALASSTTGSLNAANGYYALASNVGGSANTANGAYALYSNTSGNYNSAYGQGALYFNTTGGSNVALGYQTGRYIADGTSANATSSNSLYLGSNVRALASGDTNEIVIGNDATGLGSNTLSLGNSSTTLTYLRGNVGIGTSTPNNVLAVNGGITIASSTPSATSSALYNQGGTLYWNGSAMGGGSQWTTAGSNLYYNTGNVAIGTSTPSATARLLIAGAVATSTTVTNPISVTATGSYTATTTGAYTVYTFNGNGTFTPSGAVDVDYLVVAGGGGGGMFGAGGGAGGMATGTLASLSGTASVTIGAGGGGATARTARGSNGANSVFSTVIATGGGGGGSDNNASTNTAINNGAAGGSGGGGSYLNGSAGGTGTANQGKNGGAGGPTGSFTAAGGGGGAGAVGGNGDSTSAAISGSGGSGAVSSITGTVVTYAGGGGGGGSSNGGAGGAGGGGTGNNSATGNLSTAGSPNTGGGGGGGTNTAASAGGSGVVIVRYLTSATTTVTTALSQANQALLRVTDTGTVASSTLAFFEGTSGQGCIIAGATGLSCSSDITLKKNVNALESSLGNVLALKPVTYDWNNEADGAGNHIGFIAQDVEKLFPGLVITDPNGKKALAYDRFAPILTKAIQEISAKIDRVLTVLENGWRRLTADELCLTDSSGTPVCVTGDQLKNIGGNTRAVSTPAPVMNEPVATTTVTTITPVLDTSIASTTTADLISAPVTEVAPVVSASAPVEAPVTATISPSEPVSEPILAADGAPAPADATVTPAL